jgi:hypothetical protein
MSKQSAAKSNKSRTINDLMDDLEGEITDIKSGALSEAKARVVAKNRGMQLKAVELILQAARIEARFRPALGERLGIPALASVVGKDAKQLQ